MKPRSAIALAAVLPLLCSCSRDDGRTPVFPVAGQVLYREEPAEGALVIFNPVNATEPAAITPSGTVGPDGSFQLTSYETADGAPAGDYRVTIRWPKPPENPLEPPDMGPDRLANRFIDPDESPWHVTVTEGSNELEPFRID